MPTLRNCQITKLLKTKKWIKKRILFSQEKDAFYVINSTDAGIKLKLGIFLFYEKGNYLSRVYF